MSENLCGRCYEPAVTLLTFNCQHNPADLAGAPIGMYHCPDCGAMVVAGVTHPPMCQTCIDRRHPGLDEVDG